MKKSLSWELPAFVEKRAFPAYLAHRFTWPERPPELFYEASENTAIRFAIDELLVAEALISESQLTARIRGQWGLKSSGKRIVERVRSIAAATGSPNHHSGRGRFLRARRIGNRRVESVPLRGRRSF